jgi:uncharacterized protein
VSSDQPIQFPFDLLYRRIRPVLIGLVVLGIVIVAAEVFVNLYTSSAWYAAIGEHGVFVRKLLTELVLGLTVGTLCGAAVLVSGSLAYRFCIPVMATTTDKRASVYRRYWHRRRHFLLGLTAAIVFAVSALVAASHWQLWLPWRNATSFGQTDPQFHRDVSYYLFVYPFHRYVVNTALVIVLLALATALVVALVTGAARLRKPRRMPTAMRSLFSVLFGLLFVAKAADYWLDRYGLVVSHRGVVTGASYTDIHAVVPAKTALAILALAAALLLFANVAIRRWRVVLLGAGGLLVLGVVLGGIYPSLVQRISAKPNAEAAEQTSIERNIAATRAGFDIDNSGADIPAALAAAAPATTSQLRAAATQAWQARVLDPNRISPTFTQLQQERSIYGFKSTLDVDRYPIGGADRDLVVGVRELRVGSLPSAQKTWANQHLVYTHGYGVVAAPLDSVNANGEPAFAESGLPPTGDLGSFQPRIYFGQQSPSYSIVDGPGGGAGGRELDLPAVGDTQPQTSTTYAGSGGVPIGSWFRQLAYAMKFHDPNIVLSSQVGSGSKLLYVRDPRKRVAAVAPWLTLDGDAYPVVTAGHVLWVVDGYTTSNNYPMSQQENFRSATTNTFTTNGSSVAQSGSVNYIRNSIKATVDAYDGTVTLYSWNQAQQPDPVLQTWEKAFPGLVKPQSAIPVDLLPHLRYPQDLFNLQRQVLTQYHVSDPRAFYDGSDFWKVPNDPTVPGHPLQPSYYASYAATLGAAAGYDLTTSFTTLNRRTLAAYMTVSSTPGAGYGRINVLQAPAAAADEGPGQIQNDIESDPDVAQQLTLLRGGGSKVVLGNLQSVPLDGQMLYVEPIYERAAGGTSFPILRRVVAIYDGHIAFDSTLTAAIDGVFADVRSAASRT